MIGDDKKQFLSDLADRVESTMKTKGLKHKDVSDIVIVRGFADWRNRCSAPSVITVARLAERLEVSLEWLVLGKERETFNEKLAHDISDLPSEYRSIIEDNVEAFKRLCFKQRLGIS